MPNALQKLALKAVAAGGAVKACIRLNGVMVQLLIEPKQAADLLRSAHADEPKAPVNLELQRAARSSDASTLPQVYATFDEQAPASAPSVAAAVSTATAGATADDDADSYEVLGDDLLMDVVDGAVEESAPSTARPWVLDAAQRAASSLFPQANGANVGDKTRKLQAAYRFVKESTADHSRAVYQNLGRRPLPWGR